MRSAGKGSRKIVTRAAYKIGVVTTSSGHTQNRAAFLQALRSVGHNVSVVSVPKQLSPRARDLFASGKIFGDEKPDFLMLFCMGFTALCLSGVAQDVLPHYPFVTVWDSNPLRVLGFLHRYQRTHLALFVLDSHVATTLNEVGIEEAVYFPYCYADPTVFRPMRPELKFAHEVAFAGTFYPPHRTCTDPRVVWTENMHAVIREFETIRRDRRTYVDVYEFLRDRVNLETPEGQELSSRLMYVQKWIEREQLFQALEGTDVVCHVYGGMKGRYGTGQYPSDDVVASPNIAVHPFLDKHTDLPRLYNSTAVHLCRTQFPRACHERAFQAAACGAFLLHEWKDDVPELFEPGKELVMYRDDGELPEVIRYYLRHESERRSIAARARQRFLTEHTPTSRAQSFTRMVTNLRVRTLANPCVAA